MARELLLGATRIRQLEEDEREDLSEDVIAPGKLTAAELREHRGARGRIVPGKLTGAEHGPVRESQPGKLSLADVGRGVVPAAALRQATVFHDRRIHRDAGTRTRTSRTRAPSRNASRTSSRSIRGSGSTPPPAIAEASAGASVRASGSRTASGCDATGTAPRRSSSSRSTSRSSTPSSRRRSPSGEEVQAGFRGGGLCEWRGHVAGRASWLDDTFVRAATFR